MKNRGLLLAIALTMALALTACQSTSDADDIAVLVDDQPITIAFYDHIVGQQVQQLQQYGIDIESEEGMEVVQQIEDEVLENLIDQQLMYNHAVAEGFLIGEAEIEDELNQLKGQYSDDEFVQALEQSNLTEDMIRHDIRTSKTINDFSLSVELEFEPRVVTDDEMNEAYEEYATQTEDPVPMDEMTDELEEHLLSKQEAELYQTYYEDLIQSLRDKADIVILID